MKNRFKLCLIIIAMVAFICACTSGGKQETPSVTVAPAETLSEAISEAPETPDEVVPTEATPLPVVDAPQIEDDVPEPDLSEPVSSELSTPAPTDTELQVVIFDAGQADCVLIKAGERAMLIDAGNTGQDSLILGYLAENGVTKLDYLVATHPHADHIGSMPAVIRAMNSIGELIMPDAIHTTETFERLLDAIEEKDIPVTIPQPGDKFEMGNAKIVALAPNSGGYDDLNNYSAVLRIEYGQTAFLFTGDAEDVSENEQLKNSFTLKSDVLKVGHHGSNSSTIQKYLDVVSPSYAVISCGKDNSYGHPHSETLSKLSGQDATVFRTDENGTVKFISDGNTVTASIERETVSEEVKAEALKPEASKDDVQKVETPKAEAAEVTQSGPDGGGSYIGNKNSKIFHRPTCGTLPAEKNRVYFSSRDEAISNGHRPCKKCNL